MENQKCFDCLQREIKANYSDKLIFCYGLSDSHLPIGSTAIVQVANSSGEASPHFILKCLSLRENDCLAKYINEYCQEDCEGSLNNRSENVDSLVINHDKADVVTGIPSGNSTSLEAKTTECRKFPGSKCGSLTCDFSGRFSCSRTITALAPFARIGVSSYAIFEEIAADFISGYAEDHILCSLTSLIEGKATGRDSINFLSLIGIPSFTENAFPGCIRHPNIAPVLGILQTPSQINLALPKAAHTLQSILHYSPGALKSDWHMRFLTYQVLSGLAYMHGLGIAHGNLSPCNIMLSNYFWCWLPLSERPPSGFKSDSITEECHSPSSVQNCFEVCFSRGLYVDSKISQCLDWTYSFYQWWKGDLSNFEYLLILNRMAGRRWGDHTFYTVMPWVIDFSVKPDENKDDGWRDLSKSKWRLAKGDEQLDFTYSSSEIPHHVSDECLSELAVCSYKARRLPLSVLRMAVRSVYEPNEYPSTMQRLYQWTPDECIPEFYCDPQIFYSQHSGMSDLAVPSWAGSPEDFIKLHRDALESNRVSCHIHHWIDITFGYKMSGQAAVAAKNVMLAPSTPTESRSAGRRQLFTKPHPARLVSVLRSHERTNDHLQVNDAPGKRNMLTETTNLNKMEEAAKFCEHARHLSPSYNHPLFNYVKDDSSSKELSSKSSKDITFQKPEYVRKYGKPPIIDLDYILKCIQVDDETSPGYQEIILWRQRSSRLGVSSEKVANDIFAFGCILAELYLTRPLFDPISFPAYLESGVLPGSIQELPHPMQILVEACIQKEWRRRPSAKCLLESPYFPRTVRSSYMFLAPLQLQAKDDSRLQYAATFAKQGALKSMGAFSAEMCAPLCLPLILTPSSDSEAEWAYIVLKEFLNVLNSEAVKKLLVPAIQKILQSAGHSHLKVSLLQGSFMQEVWCQIGKQAYLETIHPYVLSNLYNAPHKSSAGAASVLLIGSSEELGAPITIHQTIFPLIHYFGKGLCGDGIDVVIRIGGNFGAHFVVKQILPLLRNVVRSCIDSSSSNKSEPSQSWSALALMDCLLALDGLVASLPRETVVKELIEDKDCLYVQILMQTNIGILVLQVAAANLIAVCQRIGPESTALYVLPKLKELFDEFAFSRENNSSSGTSSGSLKTSRIKADEGDQMESRRDLVFLLYPSLASVLGIEKLRQCCATWLLLEQFLLHRHNWKWEHTGETSRSGIESTTSRSVSFSKSTTSEFTPAKMLLHGVGWSVPQSQGSRGAKNMKSSRSLSDHQVEKQVSSSNFGIREPWYWFPSQVASWDGPDYIGRAASPKDELPWKIRSSVLESVRAHHGAIRSVAVCQDEQTVFTAGVGPGFKGTVQKWQLSTVDGLSSYHGHEEVVNDICVLTSSGRVASCDGTVHIWNGQTGKLISVFAEFPANSIQHATSSASSHKMNADQGNMLQYNPSSSGLLNTAFDESLYTTMHYLDGIDTLVVGNGSGSIRFINVSQGRKLHLWTSGSIESSFPSLISSICSCSSAKVKPDGAASCPSWVAAGLSSGYCKLFDMRTGDIIASWQAHDGYVTKLAAPEDHLLVSSSLDKTIRVWDLRRGWTAPPSMIFRGHNDGISSFSVWGKDVITISRNKIGLSSLARSADEDGQHRVTPQHLYMADRESKNMSVLSSISILPFSRLFLVGTEDGHLKICC